MAKTVGVQKGLTDIREALQNLGYEVVDTQAPVAMDAIVYLADGNDISYYGELSSATNLQASSHSKATLLINATGRSLEQIDYMIKHRVYSPLFD